MALIPFVDPAQMPEAVREALSTVPASSAVFRIAAHAETAFPTWLTLQGLLLGTLALDPRLRELAILRVAGLAQCEYERVHHEVVAVVDGVPENQIEAVRAGRITGPEFGARETILLRLVSEAVEAQGASAATTQEALAAFSAREIVEVLLVVSHYHGLALLINTLGLEAEPPVDAEAIRETRRRRAEAAAG